MQNYMVKFSEFVSLGHPDKIADYISSYLLDRYIEEDPNTRYAVEVQIKDHMVTLGGEVASEAIMTTKEITQHVRDAVREIGYTADYCRRWGMENAICADLLKVNDYIGQQSPEINRGVMTGGWGDQGIFFGMATPSPLYRHMPKDHSIAKNICKELFESGIGGLDIKTEVVMDSDNTADSVFVAIPLLQSDKATLREIEDIVRRNGAQDAREIIINGTGAYTRHSSIADCGTTGRKLAVDFYGGNCRIGGGSPWTKDGSKADLTLNIMARYLARKYAVETGVTAYARLACCIGRKEVRYVVESQSGQHIASGREDWDSKELRRKFRLDEPIYASMCRWGLFGEWQADKEWEKYTS